MFAAHVSLPLLFAVAFLLPTPSLAQLNVITSVGFEAPYNKLVPAFQKSSGITVSTKHFASQGNGPDTIAAQLRAGAAADVVIMSKEGLGELLAEGRIVPASAVDLAQARLGVAVRAGTPKPYISTVDAFRADAASLKIDQCPEHHRLLSHQKSASEARYRGRSNRQDQRRREFGGRCQRRGRDCNSPRE
jgi:ABC-type molybdate transport system substrate-binding protein